MAKEKRFVSILSEGIFSGAQILVDTMTGVNYLFVQSGNAGGMTVLVDREGKPIISPLPIREED
ncbi:MAG: xylan 1,4-beta-xylosidase [Ruminococcaceae bacterium]|nr:xylan 1,4-beta-xylosidase [Oscillospiraceae bacterium]